MRIKIDWPWIVLIFTAPIAAMVLSAAVLIPDAKERWYEPTPEVVPTQQIVSTWCEPKDVPLFDNGTDCQ